MDRFAIIHNINRISKHLESGKPISDRAYYVSLIHKEKHKLAVMDARILGASEHGLYSRAYDGEHYGKFLDGCKNDCRTSLFPGLLVDPRPGLAIVEVNTACAAELLKSRDDLVGRQLYEIMPENDAMIEANSAANLLASFSGVMRTQQPCGLPEQRFDICDPDGNFLERYWRVELSPLLDGDGQVLLINSEFFNITDKVNGAREAKAGDSGQSLACP
jgi:hypothetical protein